MSDKPNILMLFDGVCAFCSGGVRFILKRTGDHVKFCAMQSAAGLRHLEHLNLPQQDYETVVLIEGQNILFKSDVMVRLLGQMGGGWVVLSTLLRTVPKPIRDRIYDFIARHRFKIMGRRKTCLMPDAATRSRFLV